MTIVVLLPTSQKSYCRQCLSFQNRIPCKNFASMRSLYTYAEGEDKEKDDIWRTEVILIQQSKTFMHSLSERQTIVFNQETADPDSSNSDRRAAQEIFCIQQLIRGMTKSLYIYIPKYKYRVGEKPPYSYAKLHRIRHFIYLFKPRNVLQWRNYLCRPCSQINGSLSSIQIYQGFMIINN
jgi:hypothetical protein